MDTYRYLREPKVRHQLFEWWKSLSENDFERNKVKIGKGDRARLRRVERPEDALLTEPFFRFLHMMPPEWALPDNILRSALIASVLSHVDKHDDDEKMSFATQLATPKKVTDKKPRMSVLRFQQLQKSRDPEEFFRRLLRSLQLAENPINIFSLADSIWHWMEEYRFGVNRKPTKRLSVRWATDYYLALPK
ncbi:MAG: type I-E CRISPR-associated protein Cse2/CasB [Trichlorobacter sp.]|nr:type I-E CRISPR-associated protein Cse2/CasB [Trichlorobacter sp.]